MTNKWIFWFDGHVKCIQHHINTSTDQEKPVDSEMVSPTDWVCGHQ
jgi:hypothetical protein